MHTGVGDETEADDPFAINHANAKPLEGFHDVVIHGTPDSVTPTQSGSPHHNHRWLANRLTRDPSYPGGDIRLCACSSGSPDGSFAQNLANKMGVNVLAPHHTLWAFPSGNLWVGPSRSQISQSPGMWTLFRPGWRRIVRARKSRGGVATAGSGHPAPGARYSH
ncbi:hypothetical protein DER30_2286 [Streptomyces sp. HB202]|nr:hypothetical protein DER30_2286 [Streptomyces sp. HB202]